MIEIKVANFVGVEIMDNLNILENRQCVISEKSQQIADLLKKLSGEQTDLVKNLKGQIERQRKSSEKQNRIHVDSILELKKMILDLNGRHNIDMKKVKKLQEQNEKLNVALEAQEAIVNFAGTQLAMLRMDILQKQTEAETLQEDISTYSYPDESTFSGLENSSTSGTTIILFYTRSICGAPDRFLNILATVSAWGDNWRVTEDGLLKNALTLK